MTDYTGQETLFEAPDKPKTTLTSICRYKLMMVKEENYKYETARHIKEPEAIVEFAKVIELDKEIQEVFGVVCLDTKNRIVAYFEVTRGTAQASLVNPGEVYRRVLMSAACTSVIFIHNHPSGDATPSRNDILTTEQLVKSGKLLGINVLDHVIIGGEGRYTSMKNQNLI